MGKTKDLIPLKELNLTNRFLFDEVLEDPQTHQDILSIIFGRDIPLLEQNETEKEVRVSPHLRAVRMDVYAMDEEKSVYNTEMQQKKRTDLAKRSRYYQSMIDAGLLEPGIPDYNQLNNSYIIIITPFDLFGYGRYVYTFRAGCLEEPECCLEDGAVRIFLNTRGKNDGEVSKELVGFLRYVEDTTDEMAADMDSERIKRIKTFNILSKGGLKMGWWQNVYHTVVNQLALFRITDVVDIAIVSYIVYKALKFIRDTRTVQLLKGVVLVILLTQISYVAKLNTLYFILSNFLQLGIIALLIVFQPELRRALEHVGRRAASSLFVQHNDSGVAASCRVTEPEY